MSYIRTHNRDPAVASLHKSQGGDTTGEAARVLIEDVHDAIYDLVELIMTFQSKNKLAKVCLSTLFKRRQDELDAVVDRAIMRLQVRGFSVLPLHRHSGSVLGCAHLLSKAWCTMRALSGWIQSVAQSCRTEVLVESDCVLPWVSVNCLTWACEP